MISDRRAAVLAFARSDWPACDRVAVRGVRDFVFELCVVVTSDHYYCWVRNFVVGVRR